MMSEFWREAQKSVIGWVSVNSFERITEGSAVVAVARSLIFLVQNVIFLAFD